MNELYNKLVENEMLFVERSSTQFSDLTGISPETIREELERRGAEIRQIIEDTNLIIEEHITPLLNNPLEMTREQAEHLEDLAAKLSGYRASVDTGLSYNIRHALTEYSRDRDEAFYIRNMFYKGLALFYLDAIFKDEMRECYEAVIAFAPKYESFDKDTRNLIARAYGNSYISLHRHKIDEAFSLYDRAIDFWHNTAKRLDPDFPIDNFVRNVYENTCSNVISLLRSDTHSYLVKDVHIKRLYDATTQLMILANLDLGKTNDYTSSKLRYVYMRYAAEYYIGNISALELVHSLHRMYEEADSEYDYDNIFRKLHMGGLCLYYLRHVPLEDFSKEQRQKLAKSIELDVFDYVIHIPNSVSASHVSSLLTNFAFGSNTIFDDYSYLKMLLSITVFRHPPTYAHSVMVAKIAFVIVEYIAKYYPQFLADLPGINGIDDVQKRVKEILLFVWYAGLTHDIGKISYSHLVSFFVRKLNDKEFEMIKQHSTRADGFIRSLSDLGEKTDAPEIPSSNSDSAHFLNNPELFAHILDVALGHHKSYDGKFGYPSDFDNVASPVKIIIDVISIADSIDAATDNLGRSYAKGKSLEDMREDILSQCGTRYSEFVARIVFEKEYVYKAIRDILDDFRYETYYACFSIEKLSDTMNPPPTTFF